ncbi:MAG TPA: hypothetical protein VNN25_11975 [Thermoanaerobaculia bacterium]|nr:hypothetical protein [Thermoanaerobaculia bacterium]
MWQRMTGIPTQLSGASILLSDGTVLAQDFDDQYRWWRLTPDAHGDYFNGRWSHGPRMVHGHVDGATSVAPLLSGAFIAVSSQPGDPASDSFSPIAGPAEVVSAGGLEWSAEPVAREWTAVTEVLCTLPDGSVLAAGFDFGVSVDGHVWRWTPAEGWSVYVDLPADVPVFASLTLLPDGTVLALGRTNEYRLVGREWSIGSAHGLRLDDAWDCVTGPVCVLGKGGVLAFDYLGGMAFRSIGGIWSPAGQLPDRFGRSPAAYAAPACLLPSGRVLVGAEYPFSDREGIDIQVAYFEWDPVTGLHDAGSIEPDGTARNVEPPELRRMLMLPNGWVLVTRIGDIALYQPDPPSTQPEWAPRITAIDEIRIPSSERIPLTIGQHRRLHGVRLTGPSQGCVGPFNKGNPTNYPLVRIEYPDGRVFYLRTSDHSTLGIGPGEEPQSTTFLVPDWLPDGDADLCVVVNGLKDCIPVRMLQPHPRRFPGYQQLVGSLADGALWILTNGGFQPTPPGPNDGRIRAAYEKILAGIEELSRANDADPLRIHELQGIPGMSSILGGIRALRSAGRGVTKRGSTKREQ